MTPTRSLRRARELALRLPGSQRALRTGALNGIVPPSVWRRLQPTGTWTVRAPDGSPFFYASSDGDMLARSVIWTNMRHWEETTIPVFYNLARKARCFVDVGAFSGIYTLLACRANPQLTTVSVEPNPAASKMLHRNIELNNLQQRVTVSDMALSDKPGDARLMIPADTTAASLKAPSSTERSVDVTVTTGDILLGDLFVDLVKIDVEGLEAQVLQGMEKSIRSHHPSILVECLDKEALDLIREISFEFGYQHIHHFSHAGLVPAGLGLIPPRRYANFLITRDPVGKF